MDINDGMTYLGIFICAIIIIRIFGIICAIMNIIFSLINIIFFLARGIIKLLICIILIIGYIPLIFYAPYCFCCYLFNKIKKRKVEKNS